MSISKVLPAERLACELERYRSLGKKTVFTNGCFDLLHIGHVRYLQQARALGDLLVVAVNSDRSVRRIKGAPRPILPESDRAEIIASLSCVDFVTIFDEDDPLRVIELLEPDVLVKGGDWTPERIVGRDFVERRGGKVISLPLVPGVSTTALIQRISRLHNAESPR
jgi:rfaE bifunctional protein nucleotidyltransferase chain/domain